MVPGAAMLTMQLQRFVRILVVSLQYGRTKQSEAKLLYTMYIKMLDVYPFPR